MKTFVVRVGSAAGLDTYDFRGAHGATAWPKALGRGLGASGAWNFLWRLGFHPALTTIEALPSPGAEDVLAVQCDGDDLAPAVGVALGAWMAKGGRVIAAGQPAICKALGFSGEWSPASPENPYCGLAFVVDDEPMLAAPERWAFAVVRDAASDLSMSGAVALAGGERQTRARATLTVVPSAPAVVTGRAGRACFINGEPFAALQSWLQGQEDLSPWLAWRHRMFWLDEWVSDLAELLDRTGMLRLDHARSGIPGLADTTIVLRHDVDHSRDCSYLSLETARGISATHAILDDANAGFWVDRLREAPDHEAAFHYTTGGRDWVGTATNVLKGRRTGRFRATPRAVSTDGLRRQLRKARALGIGTATLHRHLLYLPYPEWIDSMSALYESDGVLGSSSLFRAQVTRWADPAASFTGVWPEAQFPLWLPFRVAHGATAGMSVGWESTSVMEAEPDFVEALLSHRVPHLRQRVLTLGYHPAHALRPTFAAGGSLSVFRSVLDVATAAGADFRTLADVYSKANEAVRRE